MRFLAASDDLSFDDAPRGRCFSVGRFVDRAIVLADQRPLFTYTYFCGHSYMGVKLLGGFLVISGLPNRRLSISVGSTPFKLALRLGTIRFVAEIVRSHLHGSTSETNQREKISRDIDYSNDIDINKWCLKER